MIKLIIFLLIIFNFIAVFFLSPLLLLDYVFKYVFSAGTNLFKKYFNYREKLALK